MSRKKLKSIMPVALRKFEKEYKIKYKQRIWAHFKAWYDEEAEMRKLNEN